MQPSRLRLSDLETFLKVAETGSLTAAGALLGVPKSTVSRRVTRLEDDLRVALVHRTGRSVTLTEHGKQLELRVASSLRDLEEAPRFLAEAEGKPRGKLRVTAPHDFGTSRGFIALLCSFRERFPEVVLDVDLSTHVVDLVAEGVDVAFRLHVRPLPDSEALRTRTLARLEAGIYASPRYLDRVGRPRSPAELRGHALVTHAFVPRDELFSVMSDTPAVTANDMPFVLGMVLAGAGVGVVPRFLAASYEAKGELERLFPERRLPEGSLSIVWPRARHTSPRLRAFLDHVTAAGAHQSFGGAPGEDEGP